MKKMWYACTMEYYSAIKNEILAFAPTWIELEILVLSEISQATKNKYSRISLKDDLGARHGWLTPVILTTLEAEIRRISVQSQP
jgi:hypothetical protein